MRACVCVHFYSAAVCKYGQASTLIASVGVCESIVTYMQPFDRSGSGVGGESAHPALMTTAESSILPLRLQLHMLASLYNQAHSSTEESWAAARPH